MPKTIASTRISILNGNSFGWVGVANEPWYKLDRELVYCGRSNYRKGLPTSPLANPYKMQWDEEHGEYPGERERVTELFRQKLRSELSDWLETGRASGLVAAVLLVAKQHKRNKQIAQKWKRERTIKLVCHCDYPRLKCHCMFIQTAIEWLVDTGKV